MKNIFKILLAATLLIGCQNTTDSNKAVSIPTKVVANDNVPIEQIIDSISFSSTGQFLLNLRQISDSIGDIYATFDLSIKKDGRWSIIQTFKMQKDGLSGLDYVASDFNNDGINDFTFTSATAARGANEIKSLFIFDPTIQQFKHIKNSDEFPNLRYNDVLDCIDSWAVYGGSTTLFLNIKDDTLKRVAGIDLFDNTMTVYTFDSIDNRRIINENTYDSLELFTRYSNYDPLTPLIEEN